jgi:hypothetical protein
MFCGKTFFHFAQKCGFVSQVSAARNTQWKRTIFTRKPRKAPIIYMVTESLSSNGRLLELRYSGYQAACHNINLGDELLVTEMYIS